MVYGDIGTSPLYAIRECFHGTYAIEVTRPNVLGVLSLVLWALLIVVTIKYLSYILRADNRGEGGVIALTALIGPTEKLKKTGISLIPIGLFAAALRDEPGIAEKIAEFRSRFQTLRFCFTDGDFGPLKERLVGTL